MWFNSENVSKPVIKIRAVPWVPFPGKAQDKAFHSPHAVTRKLPWWVGGTKLSFKHTPGSDTPSCHCRVASGACSDLAPMLCPHNTAEHQAKMPPGTPAWLSTQARTPHHTPSDIGLPQVPLLSWVQGFWTSCFLLFSSHWHQWTLGQTPGFLVETGHIAQSTSQSSKETLGISSDRPARNKGEVPANVQEVINWSCPFWYLWGFQKVAAGYFALKSHQEWRSMLSSHLLISFQNSIQKMWH